MPNRIECALSQSTFVCGLNPVRSGLEWNVGGRSLRNSRARQVGGTQVMAAGWDFADLENELLKIMDVHVLKERLH